MPDTPRGSAALVVLEGTAVFASSEVCPCGCQCFACPICGGIRCLHCDPLEVEASLGECCDDGFSSGEEGETDA